jgi:hypothetical protein
MHPTPYTLHPEQVEVDRVVVNNAELIPVHHHASDGNTPSADKPPNPNNKSHKHMPMEEGEFTTGKMYARLKRLAAYI